MTWAERLKQRYASRWSDAARRELLVLSVLNIYLPEGFRAVPTGLGSLSDEYIPRSYSSVMDAFDIVVLRGDGRIAAYLDVTGVRTASTMQPGKGLCVGLWKIWKAEKYNVKEKTWIVHVLEDHASLRFISLPYLEQHGRETRLYRDEHPLLCLETRKWKTLRQFLAWLTGVTSNG